MFPSALQQPLRIGLTGGIGSGKSTVAQMLFECGAALIDADAVSRSLTLAGGAAVPEILKQFGADAVAPDGAMDRDFMRSKVFSDPLAKASLEAIIHPLVSIECARQATVATSEGKVCIVFDIPLLVESTRWRPQLDQVLVVDCSAAKQVSRVMARNSWTVEAVHKVIASQASRSARRSAADICIYNDGLTLDQLQGLVRLVAKRFGL